LERPPQQGLSINAVYTFSMHKNLRQRCLRKLPSAFLAASFLVSAPLTSQTTSPLEQRHAELKSLFHEMWEDRLKHSPEFASQIGDKRYNGELSDYSVEAFNEALARDRAYLTRLAAIDPAGFSTQDQLSYQLAIRELVEEQTEARFKPWQMPVNQFYGIHTNLPDLVQLLRFDSVKDYDDYIARLHAIPHAFSQVDGKSPRPDEGHR